MNKRWVSNPKPAKLSASDKTRLEAVVNQFISGSSRLSEIVYRVDIKAGRIYMYRLHEQFGWDKPDVQFIKPLIDGKYAEFPMARIILYDAAGDKCEASWQRHTGQWINLFTGNITECLSFIEKNEYWSQ
ncbi:hypothetical protein [Paenibacillus elgii]|uniref:hypothetical protein n=1 Tax=Paenibacillus elgii TaxID=189691 RepID=UPI000248C8D6|nr:hypothetical protein [Paenibacillus elgii]